MYAANVSHLPSSESGELSPVEQLLRSEYLKMADSKVRPLSSVRVITLPIGNAKMLHWAKIELAGSRLQVSTTVLGKLQVEPVPCSTQGMSATPASCALAVSPVAIQFAKAGNRKTNEVLMAK
jgi:hypothetical protein